MLGERGGLNKKGSVLENGGERLNHLNTRLLCYSDPHCMLNFVSEKLPVPQKDVKEKFLPQNHSTPKIVQNLSIQKVVPKNGESKTGDQVKRQKKVQQSEKMTKKLLKKMTTSSKELLSLKLLANCLRS